MNTIQWNIDPAIKAGTTLRDVNRPEQNNMAFHVCQDANSVRENRKQLSSVLGIDCKQWVFSKQTHSDHLHEVRIQDIGKGAMEQASAIEDCDALYTKEKDIAIGVFHADCVPILLYDPYTQILCAIHSGWLGTIKEITRKTMTHLIQEEGVDPTHVFAYIGPSIALHSFEVGTDVLEKVKAMSFDTAPYIVYKNREKAYVNNKGLNERMLLDAGIPKEQIRINPNDTFMRNDAFFSYRRDKKCGRHLTYICRF